MPSEHYHELCLGVALSFMFTFMICTFRVIEEFRNVRSITVAFRIILFSYSSHFYMPCVTQVSRTDKEEDLKFRALEGFTYLVQSTKTFNRSLKTASNFLSKYRVSISPPFLICLFFIKLPGMWKCCCIMNHKVHRIKSDSKQLFFLYVEDTN